MTFLWLFLPAVLLINRLLPAKWSNVFLAAASLFFYAWGEPYYVLLILFSIGFNWYCCLLMAKHPSRRKLIMVFSAAVNLLLLVFFKYLGMLVQTANSLLAVAGIPPLPDPGIALPIGISFFTFQALSYVIDVYRGQVQVQKKLMNVAL